MDMKCSIPGDECESPGSQENQIIARPIILKAIAYQAHAKLQVGVDY